MSSTTSRIEDIYPLTALQGILLVDARSASDGRTDTLSFDLHGPVTPDQFKEAWQIVHDRHPSMRAAFHWTKVPEPMQIVRRDAVPWVRIHDDAAPAEELVDVADWPLTAPPQIRLAIVPLAPGVTRVVVGYRVAMLDGWSVALIMREFLTVTDDLAKGQESNLPPCRPFRDYIEWWQGQDRVGAERHWTDTVAGLEMTTALPMDGAPEAKTSPVGTTVAAVGAERAERLKRYAQSMAVTPNTVLQSLWGLLLSAYGGTDDVMFGMATAGRPSEIENVENIAGVFFNNLPLRVRMEADDTARNLISTTHTALRQAERHSYVSAATIRDSWDADASQPLFQSIVLFHNFPLKGTLWETDRAYTIESVEKPIETALPISLVCVPELAFELRLIAQNHVASDGLRQRYLDDLLAMIDGLTANPDSTVRELRDLVSPPTANLYRPEILERRDLRLDPSYKAPTTPAEVELAELLEPLFAVNNIGVHHNFFEIGARSIQLVRAAVRLTAAGHGPLSAVDFFEFPTVSALAARGQPDDPPSDRQEGSREDARAARRRRAERRGRS